MKSRLDPDSHLIGLLKGLDFDVVYRPPEFCEEGQTEFATIDNNYKNTSEILRARN